MTRLTVALCDDFAEERWPSMDRVAARLAAELSNGHAARIAATRVRPNFLRVATRMPVVGVSTAAAKADRFLNRFWRYPRAVKSSAR